MDLARRNFGNPRVSVSLSVLPTTLLLVAKALLNDPQLRAMALGEAARRMGESWPTVRSAAASALQALQRLGEGQPNATQLAPAPQLEDQIRPDTSIDTLLAAYSSLASGPVFSSSPQQQERATRRGAAVYVPHPAMLAACLQCFPRGVRSLPAVRYWIARSGVGAMVDDAGDPLGGTMSAGTVYYRSAPTTQWVYAIKSGDSPRAIAKRITGNEWRWEEMIPANPAFGTNSSSPGTLAYNFKSFPVGGALNIPKTWNVYIPEQGLFPAVGGIELPSKPVEAVPFPSSAPTGGEGTPYLASAPAGTVTAIKLQLGAWGKKEGAITPAGYPGPFDINETVDEPFLQATRSFQLWANTARGAKLRTDGKLDKATHDAINAYTADLAKGGVATTPPTTTPTIPTTLPGGATPLPLPTLPTSTTPTTPGSATLPGLPSMPSTPTKKPSDDTKKKGAGLVLAIVGGLLTSMITKS